VSVAEKVLWCGSFACVAAVVTCLVALRLDAPALLGVHPALKPLKFAISIGIFLATMAVLVPQLETSSTVRTVLAVILVSTNAVELGLIAVQALRGRTSHFNTSTSLDATIVLAMASAIVIMTVAVVAIAVLATVRDLPGDRAIALAWRVGLWLFLGVAISGFTMVSHGRHTVGAPDGGAGVPLVNWSRSHGDLRVAHFLALHALQGLPAIALACRWLPVEAATRMAIVGAGSAGYVGITAAAFVAALAGRPVS
jgi:hypothetical protein